MKPLEQTAAETIPWVAVVPAFPPKANRPTLRMTHRSG
jgi:hypothetical protein